VASLACAWQPKRRTLRRHVVANTFLPNRRLPAREGFFQCGAFHRRSRVQCGRDHADDVRHQAGTGGHAAYARRSRMRRSQPARASFPLLIPTALTTRRACKPSRVGTCCGSGRSPSDRISDLDRDWCAAAPGCVYGWLPVAEFFQENVPGAPAQPHTTVRGAGPLSSGGQGAGARQDCGLTHRDHACDAMT